MTVLNHLGWENSVLYTFDRALFWRVRKVDIKASAAAFSAAEPLISPTKLSAPLIDLNANAVDALTAALATELARKHRRAGAVCAAQEDTATGSYSET